MSLLRRLRFLINHRQDEADLAEEMRFHLEMKQRECEARGMKPAEAALAAHRALGSLALAQDRARDVRMPQWISDLRYALRGLRRSPAFAVTAILTIALTLAINVAIFATLNALAFRRLPAPRPEELVRLSTRFPSGQEVPFSFPMFRELARRQKATAALIGWSSSSRTVEVQGGLAAALVTAVTGNYFAEFGAIPTAGRLLLPSDVDLEALRSPTVAVIGHGFWQRHFGGALSAIGGRLLVEGTPFTIVGVAPPGFKGFGLIFESDVTVPLTAPIGEAPMNYASAGLLWLKVAGRLQSGVSLAQARAQFGAVWPAIKADIIPSTHAGAQRDNFLGLPLRLDSLATGHEPYLQGFTDPLFALQGLALIALLIGCLNLASLILRRIAGRPTDRAVRIALGASSWQALRHVLAEAVCVALSAAVCALPLGLWAGATMTQALLPPGPVPLSVNTNPDVRVLAFTASLTVLACALVGWLPAWRSTRRRDHREPTLPPARPVTASTRFLRMVVVAQLALSVILLTNAGLLLRSVQRVLTVDLGFEPDDVVRAMFMTRPGVNDRPADENYYPTLVQQMEALPGIVNASIAHMPPGSPGWGQLVSPMPWEPAEGIVAAFNAVTPGFFETLDVRVVVGRDFAWTDHARAPRVAVVNRALAARLFPNGEPLGRRIRIGTQPYRQDLEVVGVVADARLYDVKDESSYAIYISKLQDEEEPSPGGWLMVRGRIDESALQAAMQSVGPDFIRQTDRLTDAFAEALTLDRLTAQLAGVFGVAALLLVAVGVGGFFAYNVVLRTKEIAIRLAVGGEPRKIVLSILREGLLVAVAGTVLGAAAAVVSTRPVQPLLFGVSPDDPLVIVGVPAVLATVALSACWVSAVRASRADPTRGLRVD